MLEQWKVVSHRYKRVYDTKKAAKLDYGQWCNEIEDAEEGSVELYYRTDLKDEWTLVEEFGYEDEEEEEDEQEQDEDEDDEDEDEDEDDED
jgi:cobalamin biosynthesis protein CobT